MTLEQLRIFVAVAEREHVTRAARDLHLTQSAVSAAVATLEARYEVKLFNRIGRRIELTDAGRNFLTEARAVLARASDAEMMLADLAGLKRGQLALAASQTVGNYWLPPLMQHYRAQHPGISLSLTIGNSTTVAAMVHEGTADIGFVEAESDDPALSIRPVAEDILLLVAAAASEAAEYAGQTDPLRAKQLCALSWVFREPGSGTRAILEAALAEHGLSVADLSVVLELPTNEAVRAAIADGAGSAVLSKLVVRAGLKAGSLVALPFPLPKRQFFALKHKERSTTHAEAALFQLIRKEAESLE